MGYRIGVIRASQAATDNTFQFGFLLLTRAGNSLSRHDSQGLEPEARGQCNTDAIRW